MRVPPIHSFEDRMVTMSMSQEDRIAGVLRETLQKSGLRPGGAIAVLLAAIQGIGAKRLPRMSTRGRLPRSRTCSGCSPRTVRTRRRRHEDASRRKESGGRWFESTQLYQ